MIGKYCGGAPTISANFPSDLSNEELYIPRIARAKPAIQIRVRITEPTGVRGDDDIQKGCQTGALLLFHKYS